MSSARNETPYAIEFLTMQERLELVAVALRDIGINACVIPPKSSVEFKPRQLRQPLTVEG